MDRNEVKEKSKQVIDNIFNQIDELGKKKNSTQSKIGEEYYNLIDKLNFKKDELKMKYETLKNASDEKWEEAKQSFDASLEYFKKGITELSAIFK